MHKAAPIVYKSISSLNGDPNPLKEIVDSYVDSVHGCLRFQGQLNGYVSEHDIVTKRVEAIKDFKTVKSNLAIEKWDKSDFFVAFF